MAIRCFAEVYLAGVSTRKYGRVIGEMADTVGVSKSAVSRETVEASLRSAVAEGADGAPAGCVGPLVIYLDGIQMGSHHVLAAVRRGLSRKERTCWA